MLSARSRNDRLRGLASLHPSAIGMVLEGAPIPALVHEVIRDPDGTIVDWYIRYLNEAAMEQLHLDPTAVLGRTAHDVYGPAELAPRIVAARMAMGTGRPCSFESSFGPAQRLVMGTQVPIDADHFATYLQDVTEARDAEAGELAGRSGTWSWDATTGAAAWSPGLGRLLGAAKKGVVPRIADVVPAESLALMRAAMAEAVRTGAPVELDLEVRRVDGTPVWIATRGTVLRDADGNLKGYRGTATDITDRRLAADALAASEQRYRVTVEEAPAGIALVTPGGRFRAVNPAMCRILRRSQDELLCTDWPSISHPDDVEGDRAAARELLKGRTEVMHRSKRYLAPDGEVIWANVTVSCVRTPDGAPDYLVAQVVDTTEQHQTAEALEAARERIAEAERTEVIGRLMGGVAHEFNNILTGILGTTELLLETTPADAPARTDLATIQHNARRAAALTAGLLAFGRRQLLQPVTMQVADLIREAEPRLRAALGPLARLQVNEVPALPDVRIDRGQLLQVMEDLARNAGEAMPNGGTCTISAALSITSAPTPTPAAVVESRSPADSPWTRRRFVAIAISDTGRGMTPDEQSRAFEPFFSTKPAVAGVGLGLSMAQGVMIQSGGWIELVSAPGQGTTVTLYVPVAGA